LTSSIGSLTLSGILLALEELTHGKLFHRYIEDIFKFGLVIQSVVAFASLILIPRSPGWIALEGLALATAALPAASIFNQPEDRSPIWRDIQNMPSWAAGVQIPCSCSASLLLAGMLSLSSAQATLQRQHRLAKG